MSLFPDPRRIVTGHDDKGRSIVVADGTIPCEPTPAKCNFAVLYETHKFPASNNEWVDPITARTTDLSNKNGVVLRVVDFPPNTATVCFSLSLGLPLFVCQPRNRIWGNFKWLYPTQGADKAFIAISSNNIS